MKVYVVTALTAEPYEYYEWVDSVFSSEEKAKKYVSDNSGIVGEDLKNYIYGHYLHYDGEYEVQ